MKGHLRRPWTLAAAALFGLAVAAAPAAAVPTFVQFDPTGTGNFAGPTAVTGISSFDWQDTGSVVIENGLVTSSNGATTLDSFFATAVTGDTLSFQIYAHARLNGFSGGTPSPAPGLATEGAGSGTYEVTATLDAIETAVFERNVLNQAIIYFTGITGTFQYYLDTAPDSVVSTGAGFNSGDALIGGDPFLWGILTSVDGSFNGTTGSGASNLSMLIEGYNSAIIETDPAAPGWWLVGTTFDSNLQITSRIGTTDYLGNGLAIGDPLAIGDSPYTFARGDVVDGTLRGANGELILRVDASSTFTAVPEPGTMILLGSGLLGLAGVGRRRMKKSA